MSILKVLLKRLVPTGFGLIWTISTSECSSSLRESGPPVYLLQNYQKEQLLSLPILLREVFFIAQEKKNYENQQIFFMVFTQSQETNDSRVRQEPILLFKYTNMAAMMSGETRQF